MDKALKYSGFAVGAVVMACSGPALLAANTSSSADKDKTAVATTVFDPFALTQVPAQTSASSSAPARTTQAEKNAATNDNTTKSEQASEAKDKPPKEKPPKEKPPKSPKKPHDDDDGDNGHGNDH